MESDGVRDKGSPSVDDLFRPFAAIGFGEEEKPPDRVSIGAGDFFGSRINYGEGRACKNSTLVRKRSFAYVESEEEADDERDIRSSSKRRY